MKNISFCRSQQDLSFQKFYIVRYQLELLFFTSEKLNIFEFLKQRKLIDLVRIFNFLVEKTCYFGMLLRRVDFHILKKNPDPSSTFFDTRNSLLKKPTTYEVIREHRPHLIFFQETRQVMWITPAYNYVNRCRDIPSRGGGVAIGIDKCLTFRDLSSVIPTTISE